MNKLVAMLVAALVLAACGSAAEEITERAIEAGAEGDVDVELDVDDEGRGEFVIETEDGTQTVDIGSGDLPGELEIPVPDGGEVLGSSVLGSDEGLTVTATVIYAGGDFDVIVAFYEDYYASIGDISKQETSYEGGRQVVWFSQEPVRNVSVITREGEDTVEVAVIQQG